MHASKLQSPLLCCLYFEFDCLNFVCLVGRICGVRAYFQPNSVASTKNPAKPDVSRKYGSASRIFLKIRLRGLVG